MTSPCPCQKEVDSCCYNRETNQCKELNKESTNELHYVSLHILTNSKCGEFENELLNGISKRQVCAGHLDRMEEIGGCYGDSGGPLIISCKTDNTAIIYGIFSLVTLKARVINNK